LHTTVAKNFDLGRGSRLQIRLDLFSVLNKMNWGSPVTAINASDFGRITSAGGNRSIQIGSRLSF
jgi:hypothetical protein